MAEVQKRKSTITAIHNYNLRNQGWPTSFRCAIDEEASGVVEKDPVVHTKDILSVYPSNADILFVAKSASAAATVGIDTYNPFLLKKNLFGNTPAPKGHFIINAFKRNRQTISGINNIYTPSRDDERFRPISVAFFAGRVWYLMPNGDVLFSESLTDIAKVGNCFTNNDPTAEDINQVLDTDGGKIQIIGIGKGLKLIPLQSDLVVFADNGVWSISGGENPFTANNISFDQITSVGALNRDSIVDAEGTAYYWSPGGIYQLAPDETTGFLQAINITALTIQTFIGDIPEKGKANCRGFYDEVSKKILWLYNDLISYDGVLFRYKYNRVLTLDLTLTAFYPYTVAVTNPTMAGFVRKSAGSRTASTNDIVDSSADTVVTTATDQIVVEDTTVDLNNLKLKFITFTETSTDVFQYTFAEFQDRGFIDWETFDSTGVNYKSFLETGDDIVGDLITEKEANVVYIFFKSTETGFITNPVTGGLDFANPSGCFMQGMWHWTDSAGAGKWSDSQQIYRLANWIPGGTGDTFDFGFDVVQATEQIRGKGRALRLRFDSEDGKDFHLLGWGIVYTGMTAP